MIPRRLVFVSIAVGISVVLGLSGCTRAETPAEAAREAAPRYEYGTPTRGVGTGKYYLGREIADPVSPSSVPWMERPARAE